MWKVNLGFVLALAVLGLSALGSYDSIRQLLANGRESRAAHGDRLVQLQAKFSSQEPAPSAETVRAALAAAAAEEEADSRERERRAEEGANRAVTIILVATLLAVLITGLSVVVINRDVRAREEAEVQLALAHANLEGRVRERTADLGRANEELQKARTDLEGRVRERTADLHHANEELRRVSAAAEAASRAKSEFLANMSHELRTPLNSVIGFTNILLKNKAGNLREQDLTFLERVLDNGKHLLTLINQVLDLAKVEAGRMELECGPVALDDLVHSTLAGLEGQVKGKDVKLVAEIPPRLAPIETDPGKLKQVLINLVGNAIKFTDRGNVTVRVEADADGRPLALDVIDTGAGIPADKLQVIFEAFEQGDVGSTREYGGTGLGLTIARSLCRLMGYEITVHSRVGYGSMFRVALRDRREEALPGHPRLSPTTEIVLRAGQVPALEELRGKRVLIIDDDRDSRILLTQYVEDCGCRVLAADCGQQGLMVGEQFLPDLIVLDLVMPGMNGWEVLKSLKAHPTLSGVPVVVVSIVARENRGTILGAVDLLDKPVSREALHAILVRNLRSRQGRALVVDDNADARRLMSAYLAEEGFETCEAANGAEALERLHAFHADLVILDLTMPVMDGLSFLDALRRDPRYLHLPVVVVTAKDLTPQEAQRLGADGSAVLRKGDELALGLKRVVSQVLGHRAARLDTEPDG
jgi:signal transduction histidine kinase/CheY-like chemotaxis protein